MTERETIIMVIIVVMTLVPWGVRWLLQKAWEESSQ